MANIAKLALKIVADMEKAQEDFAHVTSAISNVQKSAQSASPSMKNLTDAVKGLEIMEGAVQKAVWEIGIDGKVRRQTSLEAVDCALKQSVANNNQIK